LRPGAVQLAGLLGRVVQDLAPQAATVGASIVLDAPTPVCGWWDDFRIEQIVVNLLTNALRYGGARPVVVTLTVMADSVRVDVRDNGPGIAPQHQARIFDVYERGVDSEGPSGLGLGLYISRQLAEAHGGSLTLHSEAGAGAVFSLTLPRTEASPADAG
jgi:signal transduction histidine kinase